MTDTTIEEDARAYVAELDRTSHNAPVNTTHVTLRRYRGKWGTSSFDSIVTVVLGEEKGA